MVSLLMHICVTRPQWVNKLQDKYKEQKNSNYFEGHIAALTPEEVSPNRI